MNTSYENHKRLKGHPMTREAVGEATITPADIVETCSTCGQRWLFQYNREYPISLRPMPQPQRD